MTPLVPDFVLLKDSLGETEGTESAAAIFADISGFTALTEHLVPHGRPGAEALARTLRHYFDPLVRAVHEHGGFITGFAGDAFTALFPESSVPNAKAHALEAARRMQGFFEHEPRHETPFGTFAFALKIGISWGDARFGIVRASEDRSYYYFHGPAIDWCAAAEHGAAPGGIALHPSFGDAGGGGGPLDFARGRQAPALAGPGRGAHFLPAGIDALPMEGEFRNVANVFLSLEDVPSHPDLVRRLHALATRFGGATTGLDFGDKGQNCLVHFGAPVAHENDLERALQFALDALSGLGTNKVRAGVTWGILYAGYNGGAERHALACLGRSTNLSARLMMQAPWGEIWCDGKVAAKMRGRYRIEDRGLFPFKGFDAPLAVHAILGRRAAKRAFRATELLGRESEMAALHASIDPIFDGRFAGIVYVHGEAGLGKSFLVETFRLEVEAARGDGVCVIDAPCDQTLRAAFHPFVGALRQAFEQDDAQDEASNRDRYEASLSLLLSKLPKSARVLATEIERLRSVLGALLGFRQPGSLYESLDPKLRFENTVLALRSWLFAESQVRPLVVHVADCHWLDPDSAEALASIAVASARCGSPPRLAIILTARPSDDGSRFRLALDETVPQSAIELGHLTKEALARLVKIEAGGPAAARLVRLLEEKAQGNPFFATQLLTYLRENGLLLLGDDGLSTVAEGVVLPEDLDALLIARLDRLGAEVKRVVQAASVLGNEVPLRLLEAMLQGVAGVMTSVRAAEGQGIWDALDELRYLFRHALLRDAAYEMQARSRLAALHRLAAEAMESLYREDRDRHLALLGHHWEHAGEIERAKSCYLTGARQARERYAHGEAKGLYRACLRLLGEGAAEEIPTRTELGKVLDLEGRTDEARVEFQAALEAARNRGDRRMEAWSLKDLARLDLHAPDKAQAPAALERVLAMALELEDRSLHATALADLAQLHREQGRLELARTMFAEALVIARETGDRHMEGKMLSAVANTAFEQGHTADCQALYEQALAMHRQAGDHTAEAIVLGRLALCHKEQGRVDAAKDLYLLALALARQVGERRFEAVTLGNLAILHQEQGRSARAKGLYEQALLIYREAAHGIGEEVAIGNLANLLAETGEADAAKERYGQALAIARRIGDRQGVAILRGNIANLRRGLGALEECGPLYEEALTILREIGDRRFEGITLGDIARLHEALGHRDDALMAFEQALAIHREVGNRRYEGITLVRMARLRRISGRIDEARRLLEEAGPILESAKDVETLVQCLCERGHVALASHEPAADLAAKARALAESLPGGAEMVADLERAIRDSEEGPAAGGARGAPDVTSDR